MKVCLFHRCDMEGRVVGGVGAIAGFDWWPIKAYRPCPALEAAGVAYTRYWTIKNFDFRGPECAPTHLKS